MPTSGRSQAGDKLIVFFTTRRFVRWLISAAAGAMALAAIVVITLETQKGQIVIESLVPM